MAIRRKITFKEYAPGQALVMAIIFLAIIASASSALLGYVGSVAKFEKTTGEEKLALQIAQAGIDKAIWCLNQGSGTNCGGTFGGNFIGETAVAAPPGEFTTSITSIDSSTKEITSTGYIPNSDDPAFSKTIRARATIDTDQVNFSFGMQVGDGGATMENTSRVNGSVYSNGSIDGDGGEGSKSTITGDVYVAGGSAPTPDQEWTATNSDFTFGQGSPQTDVAQSFIPSVSGQINKFSFYIKKVGNPSNRTVRLVRDNGNKPDDDSLESGTLSASLVTTSYGWVDVTLDDPQSVTAGTRYWIVIDASNNASNYWKWAIDTTNSYANGKGMYSPDWDDHSPSWTDAGGDFNFKVWMGGVTTFIDELVVGGNAHANTIDDSDITGDAYYQSIDDSTVDGTSYPGSPDPVPTVFPISDNQILDWKNDAAAGDLIEGDVHPDKDETVTLGPAKITGDIILDDGQTLVITGTLYVEGNVDIGNKGKLQLSPSYGSNSGMIISDGWMHFENNGAFSSAGAGSYLMLLSTAAGGTHHSAAMDLHNNVTGVILFAPNGTVHLHNNVHITQLTAKKIELDNGCILTYDIGLANVNFSSGPTGAWEFVPGTWRITD